MQVHDPEDAHLSVVVVTHWTEDGLMALIKSPELTVAYYLAEICF
jgi:hypothetical protein